MLYLMSLLHVSGEFKVYIPADRRSRRRVSTLKRLAATAVRLFAESGPARTHPFPNPPERPVRVRLRTHLTNG
jgi:hypothetical protein